MTTTENIGGNQKQDIIEPTINLVAWEVTRSCNLYCAHCRASASSQQYEDELTTEECFRVIDQILEVGRPIIILTGGEPLMRKDVFTIAEYASGKGLRVAMGSNGTLITEEIATKLKAVPIPRVAISIDFPVAELEDEFRGQKGAFEAAMRGIDIARRAGIGIQINSTITRLNVQYLEDLISLALKVGAGAFHPFMLVPTGRGKSLESVELSPQEYEDTLGWIYDRQIELGDRLFFKPTDAPHYLRIMAQKQKEGRRSGSPPSQRPAHSGGHPAQSISRGCLAGTGFAFISHQGRVQGCGYLDVAAGNLRQQSFGDVWTNSTVFNNLRDLSNIKGKCGVCEYKRICGGCRARAYEATGDYLEEEPYCIHQPVALQKTQAEGQTG